MTRRGSSNAVRAFEELRQDSRKYPSGPTTIVAVPHRPHLRSICVQEGDTLPTLVGASEKLFKIRLADSEGHRSAASYLVKRRYAWRGYEVDGVDTQPNRITLSACDQDETVVATISVGLDSGAGLFVDALYRDEVDRVRAEDRRVCEFTKLAIDGSVQSKPVLAALFHIAFVYARRLKRCTDLFIEVNPRHVLFYRHMLGFEAWGTTRFDRRVDAPAVLLRLDLSHAERQIAEFGGHPEVASQKRSLYPYFFSPREESDVVHRLRALE
jgi:N-acyl amino acid synthase FeeM